MSWQELEDIRLSVLELQRDSALAAYRPTEMIGSLVKNVEF